MIFLTPTYTERPKAYSPSKEDKFLVGKCRIFAVIYYNGKYSRR
ncbi:hypothetical protein [Thalassomonas viridans]|nr:hypothetical protein [Thalassomonas viridans]